MKPPIPGMKVVPKFYGNEMWKLCGGASWLGLLEWALTRPEIVAAFESETGHSLKSRGRAAPIDRMIDDASGRTEVVMAAWCDWVTSNYWGVEP